MVACGAGKLGTSLAGEGTIRVCLPHCVGGYPPLSAIRRYPFPAGVSQPPSGEEVIGATVRLMRCLMLPKPPPKVCGGTQHQRDAPGN